jgi:NTP pyrophosphatase (non-canonical NTP hydrolase)
MPTLRQLAQANAERQKEWDVNNQITASYRGNELAGETGEACNVIKKLERERMGIRGSRSSTEKLAEELADVIICASLIANSYSIDLDEAVENKFNKTSIEQQLVTRLGSTSELTEDDKIAAKGAAWIGVDLDGTLAHYDGWGSYDEIGEPLEPMLTRVKEFLAAGEEVRIFTARASYDVDVCRTTGVRFTRADMTRAIQDWCERVGLPRLRVTNVKDIYMKELWDDRAVQMIPNTGKTLSDNYIAETTAKRGKAYGSR